MLCFASLSGVFYIWQQLNPSALDVAKSLAASALSQRGGDKQTGAKMEDKAARVLASDRSAKEMKELAASILSQANKQR